MRRRRPGRKGLVATSLAAAVALAGSPTAAAPGSGEVGSSGRTAAVTVSGGCGLTLTPWAHGRDAFDVARAVALGDAVAAVATDGRILFLDTRGRPRTDIGTGGVVAGLAGVVAALGRDDGGLLLAAPASGGGGRGVELLQLDAAGAPDAAFGTSGRAIVALPGTTDDAFAMSLAPAPAGDVLVTTRTDTDGVVVRLGPDGAGRPGFGTDGVATFDLGGGGWPGVAAAVGGRVLVLGAASGGFGTGSGVVWGLDAAGQLDPAIGSGGRLDLDGAVGTQALAVVSDGLLSFADASDGSGGHVGTIDLGSGHVRSDGAPLPTDGTARWVAGRWVVGATARAGGFGEAVVVATRRDPRGRLDTAYGTGGAQRLDPSAALRLDLSAAAAVHPDGAVSAVAVAPDWDGRPAVVRLQVEPDGALAREHGWCPDDDRPAEPTVRRLQGATRHATAVALSRTGHPGGSDHVVVATGAAFPDALAGGPAAAALGGPILLVERDRVPDEVATELGRLAPTAVTLLGGPAALSSAVADDVARLTGTTPRRLEGTDRYATAAAISRATFAPGVPVAFVTTGENFPDALATGAIAGTLGGPVLLTTRAGGVPEVTLRELDRLDADEVVVVGGPDAVGDTAVALAARLGDRVDAIAGADRYETARRVVTRYRDEPDGHLGRPVTTVFVATGENYPDALAGAALAGTAGGIVALVPPTTFDERVRDLLGRLHPRTLYVLGGPVAIDGVWDDALRGVGATSWTYIADPVGPTDPVRWDPCRPIRWVFNPDGSPPGGQDLVTQALARVGEATGWEFRFDGQTDEPLTLAGRSPHQPGRYPGGWAPVLIGWGRPPSGGAAGQAGPTWVDDVNVTGELVLDRDLSLPVSFAEGGWGDIVLHEVGHVLGLDHPGDPTQTMYWRVVAGVSGLQPGDLAGMRRLHAGGCVDVPDPAGIPGRSVTRARLP